MEMGAWGKRKVTFSSNGVGAPCSFASSSPRGSICEAHTVYATLLKHWANLWLGVV